MKVILATGIYPPEIGGPAGYVRNLAIVLTNLGADVVVVTYSEKCKVKSEKCDVARVKKGFPIIRWFKYAKALKKIGADADIIYAFSSVSCGVPAKLARLRKPKKVLRLGGDFFWERYTALGGKLGLRDWYNVGSLVAGHWSLVTRFIFRTFDHIVFSTDFQKKIYEGHFKKLPDHSVIENAVPSGKPEYHVKNEPFKLLFMGRFVGFKNLPALIKAMELVDGVRLTMIGDGPLKNKLKKQASKLENKIMFASPVFGEEKKKIFDGHDLMIIPSITEISPNVALEAGASGLPVLVTEETGLSAELSEAMVLRDLETPEAIKIAVEEVVENYEDVAEAASRRVSERGWGEVGREHIELFNTKITS